jgi:hypothetical protein
MVTMWPTLPEVKLHAESLKSATAKAVVQSNVDAERQYEVHSSLPCGGCIPQCYLSEESVLVSE